MASALEKKIQSLLQQIEEISIGRAGLLQISKEIYLLLDPDIRHIQEESEKAEFQSLSQEQQFFTGPWTNIHIPYYFHKWRCQILLFPYGGIEAKKDHWSKVKKSFHQFFIDHVDLITYLRMDNSQNDHLYYLKKSTEKDTLAQIKAAEMLDDLFDQPLERILENLDSPKKAIEVIEHKFTKAQITQLIYAFHELNKATSTEGLKSIAKKLGAVLGVDLSEDLYRQFQKIKNNPHRATFFKELDVALQELLDRD